MARLSPGLAGIKGNAKNQEASLRNIYLINLFLERGQGREKERERNIGVRHTDQLPLTCPHMGTWPITQARAPTGNPTSELSFAGWCSIH